MDRKRVRHPVLAQRVDEDVDEQVDRRGREDEPLETLEVALDAGKQVRPLPDDEVEEEVAGEEEEREPELPLDETVEREADDRERRGQCRDAHDQVIRDSGDQAIPFWNSAMSLWPIFTGTRFLFGPPTASRSGLTPRAPAEATVCDCCACVPPPGLSLPNRPPPFFGSSFLALPSSRRRRSSSPRRRVEAARPFRDRRESARRLGVERDVLRVARLHGRRRARASFRGSSCRCW